MTWEQITKLQNDEFEYLDSLDLEPYLIEGEDIWDIRDKIEDDFGEGYYEPFIFNCISIDEFIDYLKKRYGNKIYFNEHTTYSLHLND